MLHKISKSWNEICKGNLFFSQFNVQNRSHVFLLCFVVQYWTFFLSVRFFLTASAIYSLGVLSFTIAFLKPFFFLLISLEITYLNIYTHNNKFFFVCFDSCMRYFKFFKFFCGFFMDFFLFSFLQPSISNFNDG